MSSVSGVGGGDAASGRPSAYGLPVIPVGGPAFGLGKVYVEEQDIPDDGSDVAGECDASSSGGDLDSTASVVLDDELAQGIDDVAQQSSCDADVDVSDGEWTDWCGAARDVPWGN